MFGPADICVNAVSFFVDAAVQVKKIFESLDDLLGNLSEALYRFDIYRDAQAVLDRGMKRRANLILLTFVKICDVAYKLLAKKGFFGSLETFGKNLLFKSDSGVQKQLDLLEKLTHDEAQVRETYTYVTVKRLESSIEQMREDAKKAEVSNEREKQIQGLEDKLDKFDQAHGKKWRYCMGQASSIPDSGQWISDHEAYNAWVDLDQSRRQLLMLWGDEGCGKTVLVSKIIEGLQKLFPRKTTNDTKKVFVAYHYCSLLADHSRKDSRDGAAGTKDTSCTIDAALRALALQVALADEVYRKNLYNLLKDSQTLSTNVEELWETLFVKTTSDASFFLVFDDVHEAADTDNLSKLMKAIEAQSSTTSRIRVLISGRTELLQSLITEFQLSDSAVDVSSSNDDIAKYVSNEVNKMPLLKGATAELEALRIDICSVLGSIRNFQQIAPFLNEIEGKKRASDIQAVLDRAKTGSDMKGSLLFKLDQCNQLDERDIEDLNKLLEWTLSVFVVLKLSEFEIVLRIRKHDSSLKSLRARLEDEFLGLFSVLDDEDRPDNPFVDYISDTLKDYFRERTEQKQQKSASSKDKITKMEVKMMQQFLGNLCGKELYTKFGFADFLKKKLDKSVKVHVNTDEMHARVALDCFMVLLYETDSKTEALMGYVRNYWVNHLGKCDLSLVSPDLKHELGEKLLPMFTDEEAMAKWMLPGMPPYAWVTSNAWTPVILRWVQDSGVSKRSSAATKDWVKGLSASSTVPEEALWLAAVTYKAREWLIGIDPVPQTRIKLWWPFRWVRAFFNRVSTLTTAIERCAN